MLRHPRVTSVQNRRREGYDLAAASDNQFSLA